MQENPSDEFEENSYVLNDEMSESLPSHVSVDAGSKDEDGSVHGGSPSPKSKRQKRKNGAPVSPKPKGKKRGRGKTSKCWQHFTMAKPEGETVEKARCNYCLNFFCIQSRGANI